MIALPHVLFDREIGALNGRRKVLGKLEALFRLYFVKQAMHRLCCIPEQLACTVQEEWPCRDQPRKSDSERLLITPLSFTVCGACASPLPDDGSPRPTPLAALPWGDPGVGKACLVRPQASTDEVVRRYGQQERRIRTAAKRQRPEAIVTKLRQAWVFAGQRPPRLDAMQDRLLALEPRDRD